MTKPTPHTHAGMIAEWIKDTSRVVLIRSKEFPRHWSKDDYPTWEHGWEYRFADEVKPENKMVSSLSDEYLSSLNDGSYWNGLTATNRAIADAAAQRAIRDLKMPDEEWFEVFDHPEFARYKLSEADIIGTYLDHLKMGKL